MVYKSLDSISSLFHLWHNLIYQFHFEYDFSDENIKGLKL